MRWHLVRLAHSNVMVAKEGLGTVEAKDGTRAAEGNTTVVDSQDTVMRLGGAGLTPQRLLAVLLGVGSGGNGLNRSHRK